MGVLVWHARAGPGMLAYEAESQWVVSMVVGSAEAIDSIRISLLSVWHLVML